MVALTSASCGIRSRDSEMRRPPRDTRGTHIFVQRIECSPHFGHTRAPAPSSRSTGQLTFAIVERGVRDLIAPAAIDRVMKSGMIGIQLHEFRGSVVVDLRL